MAVRPELSYNIAMDFAEMFSSLPPELAVFLLAMLPIVELRGAIPIGILAYDLSPVVTYVWAVLGNIIPAIAILTLIGPVSNWFAKRSKFITKVLDWWFDRSHRKFINKYKKYGPIALALFVAIPLPVTGAWTGATAAWLLKINFRTALMFIIIGVLIAGLIVTALSTGAISIFS